MSKDLIPKLVVGLIAAVIIATAVLVFVPFRVSEQTFVVKEGVGLSVIAKELKDKDIIVSKNAFIAYVVLTGQSKELKAGKYQIPSSRLSIFDISQSLINGDEGFGDVVVLIPEGANVGDIDRILSEKGLIKVGQFLEYFLDQEGYFFPDTYKFKPGLRESKLEISEIANKLKDNFEKKTIADFAGVSASAQKDAIIIASLLEKEARDASDIYIISGIIHNRLEAGMKLEIDASVAYGACMTKFVLSEYCNTSQVRLVDNIHKDSLYNTYSRIGLPVGPISNPGLLAIDAALHPKANPYFYYLHARNGQAIFSKTGAEHVANRKKYLGL